ncbi:di-trans,poly-cis-decaprenylcistransferas-like protein [Corynespora cassiicola Philippines]|uniref:ditrans,polycis-polyprenyl diphosphate synthase [(2E,6E)-farnesyldiphosphate specific] n=1 Tax=Corynespora cassiicola Philippines TaxID=1448308 RepID=A0A2T2NCA6_CORCC|nr:di-trans,poly-cis-decaprenylcistransferas-like protein [Corynespora cassiicola Philippines]
MATTGISLKEETAFRRGTVDGKQLSAREREELLKSHLPPDPSSSSPSPSRKNSKRTRNRRLSQPKLKKYGPVRTFIHFVIYHTIALFFSVYFRFRRAWRLAKGKAVAVLKYHHRTPEFIARDVRHLEQMPEHLSVVLEIHEDDESQGISGLEGLVSDVCEIAAWTTSAGIPFLSVYERTGALKRRIPELHNAVSQTLEAYFGSRRKPTLSLRAPHLGTYSPPNTPPSSDVNGAGSERPRLVMQLLSEVDGRDTVIDLTKTLTKMAQKGHIQVKQISEELIDGELIDHMSKEPDLLILFSPTITLKGYPPWQLRLTEIFHLPDNKGVNYQVFLRALHSYAKMEMRLGR